MLFYIGPPSDWHLVVTTPHVHIAKKIGSPHRVEDVFDAGQRVAIQRRLQVEGAVVFALPEVGVVALCVLLPYHHRGRGVQGLRRTLDESEGLQFAALRLHEVPLDLPELVWGSEDWFVGVQVDV